MQRAIVIGCPGSGKSTFARALQNLTELPLHYLDMLYWNADRTTVAKEVFRARLAEVIAKDRWIIDGNYASTMAWRMQRCDTVFFLDYPLEVCLQGVESRRGQSRPDMPWVETGTDGEFLAFIRAYREESRPAVLDLLAQHPEKDVHIFRSREEAAAYLASLEGSMSKTSTEGLKLFSGGKEVTPEQIRQIMQESKRKKASPEYRKEVALLFEMMQPKSTPRFRYYRLLFAPFTLFRVDRELLTSHRFHEATRQWEEAAWFFADLEHGEVRAEEVDFDDPCKPDETEAP